MNKPTIIQLCSHRKAARVELNDPPDVRHRFKWVIIQEDTLEAINPKLDKRIELSPAAAISLAEEIIKGAGGKVNW